MKERVVITGLGCVTPVGNDTGTTWDNLINGKSGGGPITYFDPTEFKSQVAAEVKGFNPKELFGVKNSRRMDKYTQFAMAASMQAFEESGLEVTEKNRDRIGILIGTGIGGLGTIQSQTERMRSSGPNRINPFFIPMILPDSAGGLIAIKLGVRGPNMAILTACASGSNSIGEAAEIIRRGQADVMLAGGSEASIVPIGMAGMSSMTALTTRNDDPEKASRPFDRDRDGFLMGEGAGVIVLESLDHAISRGANILAELSGYGSTNDAYHISAPSENGAGAVRCMNMALENSEINLQEIDYINAHGTSTYLNDKSETAAIKTVFGETAYDIPISSTKSMTGHLIGASGAIEAIISSQVIANNQLPPTINYETPDPDCDLDYVPNQAREKNVQHVMSNSFGFGGHNATLIISEFN